MPRHVRATFHQAQRAEQQRKHGRASVSEPHVSPGPLGSAAGSRMLRPSGNTRRDQARGFGFDLLLLDKWQQ